MRKIKIRKVTTKIIIWICALMMVVILVSDVAAYMFFSNKMMEQEYDSERDKIELVSNQISYVMEDIEKFALAIAVDENIQSYLRGEAETTNFLEKQLGLWEVQRDYIFNLVLKKNDNNDILLSDSVMISGISKSLYRSLMGHTLECEMNTDKTLTVMPEISEISRLNLQCRLLTCVINIYHMTKYKEPLGQLIINLDYDKILEIVKRDLDTAAFEKIYWTSSEHALLFPDPSEALAEEYEEVNRINAYVENTGNKAFALNGCYVVTGSEKISGWNFVSVTDIRSIHSRIYYIIAFFFIAALLCGILGSIGISKICHRLMRPVTTLKENMEGISTDDFAYKPVVIRTGDEFETLANGYNSMMERIEHYIDSNLTYEREKKELEMALLLAQINPHFIYNTLNTIIYLAYKKDTESIAEVTRSFITLLQDSVKIHEAGMLVAVENELKVVESYLELQKKRYADRFEVEIHAAPEIMGKEILRSVLQPIVENSLLHGIFLKNEKGLIRINFSMESDMLFCRLFDNGCGMTEEQIRQIKDLAVSDRSSGVHSIGLSNILKRMELAYSDKYIFEIDSKPGQYTEILIGFPLES